MLCPAGFGVLLSCVVLSCRLTPQTTGQSCQECFFLAGGVLECNLAHRRSVAELCMLFKIKSNQMHPLSGAFPLPYVPARVTRGALVAHRHSFAPPHCRTSLYRRTIVPLSVSLWNDLSDTVFDWRASRAEPMLSCWHDLLFLFCLLLFYLFLPSMGWLCGFGVFGLIECSHSLPVCTADSNLIIIIFIWYRVMACNISK